MPVPEGLNYDWDPASTYIRRPPFWTILLLMCRPLDIEGARVLVFLGDSVTTDHISPAGAIPAQTPAGRHLLSPNRTAGFQLLRLEARESRSDGPRDVCKHSHQEQAVEGVTGGFTRHLPDGEQMTIYEAAEQYRDEGVPLLVLAGKEYGTGSSRDWAAKGTALLGVKAVIAESYERIHRNNLIGTGVLPLQFPERCFSRSLG
jgi:aconitate hydratase